MPHDVTMIVNLHLTREFRFRKWIAVHLIELAILILGCGIEVKDD